jgi:putative SbcD/Mre11-related phosphoesterase
MLQFLKDNPALLIGKTLVIADLHIGLEYELAGSGFNIPNQTDTMLSRVSRLIKENRCKELVILGDIKHTILRAPPEARQDVLRFVERLQDKVEVTLVQGNHDAGLRNYFPDMVSSKGLKMRGTYLLHGHALPGATMKKMVMGHMHPVVEFRDSLGGRVSERVWLRCPLKKGGTLYVMPAFNQLLGGTDVRHGILGPMKKYVDYKASEIYLTDGLYVGEVGDLK